MIFSKLTTITPSGPAPRWDWCTPLSHNLSDLCDWWKWGWASHRWWGELSLHTASKLNTFTSCFEGFLFSTNFSFSWVILFNTSTFMMFTSSHRCLAYWLESCLAMMLILSSWISRARGSTQLLPQVCVHIFEHIHTCTAINIQMQVNMQTHGKHTVL